MDRIDFSEKDRDFMCAALDAAVKTMSIGNLPVGAVLAVDGNFKAIAANMLYSHNNWASHAESLLLRENSSFLMNIRSESPCVELYTTLEPCLMCLGSAVLHRVSRIVYACPDPYGGASMLQPDWLSLGYRGIWPLIKGGLFRDESYRLLLDFMRNTRPDWDDALACFEGMNSR